MHLPLLSRVLFLLVQFLILTMALPAARHASPPTTEQIAEREAAADVTEQPRPRSVVRNRFGRRLNIEKPGSPVKAMVRSPDAFPRKRE